jgi:hypothetical protein
VSARNRYRPWFREPDEFTEQARENMVMAATLDRVNKMEAHLQRKWMEIWEGVTR